LGQPCFSCMKVLDIIGHYFDLHSFSIMFSILLVNLA